PHLLSAAARTAKNPDRTVCIRPGFFTSYFTYRGVVSGLVLAVLALAAKAVLLALADALEVGAVHVEHHRRHDGGPYGGDGQIPVGQAGEQAVAQSQEGVADGHDDAAQREIGRAH